MVESMCGLSKRNCLGFQQPPALTQSPLVSQPEVVGTYLPGTGTLDWGPGVGLGLFTPEIALPNFYPRGCGARAFCVCAPPTSHDTCGFFYSIVVRLPFNTISDVPE